MTLPAPNLDDRTFQDLVDDAKRLVQRKWPEWSGWTDHNVSDPGVTLIESVAFMIDQLLYRVNRTTDRNYVKFLDLLGLTLLAPTAATAPVTFWLSAARDHDVDVPAGTEVATDGTDTTGALVFRTVEPLTIVARHRAGVAVQVAGGDEQDLTDPLASQAEIALFGPRPAPGDAFFVGLDGAAPSCLVGLRFAGDVQGYGINPDFPPLRWEAYDGNGWVPCAVERDETGGFNRAGDVLLHLPDTHQASVVARRRAGWLRCVVTIPGPGGAMYDASPKVRSVEAFTLGGTVVAVHATEVALEVVGTAEGVAGQRLALQHVPVVLGDDAEILEVLTDVVDESGTTTTLVEEWGRVETFAHAATNERCFTVVPATGEVCLPPAVREPDGTVRRYGAVPRAGSVLRMRSYRTGGGRAGNVGPRALRNLRSSLPFVATVENLVAASGGIDGETIEEAKVRGPLLLRTRDRAVTASDFELLTRQAAPEIARVRCVEAGAGDPGAIRILVVPRTDSADDVGSRIRFDQLQPTAPTLERIAAYLDERRVIGTRVVVEVPSYQGVTVVARLRTRRNAAAAVVEQRAEEALFAYFHPVTGGPDGGGWPFGRPIQAGEVHAVLQRVPGVDFVEQAFLFTYDAATGARGTAQVERIAVGPDALVFSFGHDVRAEPAS